MKGPKYRKAKSPKSRGQRTKLRRWKVLKALTDRLGRPIGSEEYQAVCKALDTALTTETPTNLNRLLKRLQAGGLRTTSPLSGRHTGAYYQNWVGQAQGARSRVPEANEGRPTPLRLADDPVRMAEQRAYWDRILREMAQQPYPTIAWDTETQAATMIRQNR